MNEHANLGQPVRPSSWVVRFAELIRPGGRVLDLACGGGRHARWLAQQGRMVLAVDRDEPALLMLGGTPGVVTLAADLEDGPWPFGNEGFDGIVVTNYLHRPLFPAIEASLNAGGALIYETFMTGNERHGKPASPRFLLRPGELLEAFAGLSVVAFEQGEVDLPRPAVVQRLCAVKGNLGRLPSGANERFSQSQEGRAG